MNALGLLMRRSLRTHARAAIGLALVVAITGGLSIATFAAARRTASAFTRFLAASETSDLSIALFPEAGADTPEDFIADTDPLLAAAKRIPGVERTSSHLGLTNMYLATDEGRADPDGPETIASLDGRYEETDRVTVLEGRRPRPDRLDEVLVNPPAVDLYGMRLGSRHELVVIGGGLEIDDVAGAEIADSFEVRVVGVGRFPEEVLRDEYDHDGLMLLTRARNTAYIENGFASYRFQALHLAPGADPSQVVAEYEALAGDRYGLIVRRTDEQRVGAQLALRPIVVALGVFGVLTALAALSLGALGAARVTATAATDVPLLRAIGLAPTATVLTAATPALIAVAAGAVGAAVLAFVMSPIAPIGPVREVEAERGFDLDATVVLVGFGVLLVVLMLVTLVGAAWVVRRQARPERLPSRTPMLTAQLERLALPPAASIGVREGLGAGPTRTGTAIRPTLASCTLSIVALVATLTFGASVDGLIDTPDRYGWAADRALVAGAGYIDIPPAAAAALEARPEVRSVALAYYAPVQLGGRTVSGMGIDGTTGTPAVTLIEGRLPANGREVALGINTARDLDAGLGDVVAASKTDVTVVGIVALPAIGLAGVSHPSMSQGAVLTQEGLSMRNGSAFPGVAFVDFEEGTDTTAAAPGARRALATSMQISPDAIGVFDPLRPAVLVEVDSTKATALALAGVLGGAAVLALAFTLSASVRRRRSQLAVLASLGFDQRDLRRSVRWQTGCVTAVALGLGVPLGVLAGRLWWVAFAEQIGVDPVSEVPLAVLAVTVVVIVALAAAVGERPARTAARTPPAAALRPLA